MALFKGIRNDGPACEASINRRKEFFPEHKSSIERYLKITQSFVTPATLAPSLAAETASCAKFIGPGSSANLASHTGHNRSAQLKPRYPMNMTRYCSDGSRVRTWPSNSLRTCRGNSPWQSILFAAVATKSSAPPGSSTRKLITLWESAGRSRLAWHAATLARTPPR
jgi:hypothetical protein